MSYFIVINKYKELVDDYDTLEEARNAKAEFEKEVPEDGPFKIIEE